eukprot:TRINITY_DN10324_c0_g1_i2.p2 TRINITY_DN10324_c0_g1~~TRINITY_DN10324_c0_g1_i2.p2  ORF type:complete len:173 (+),score=8.06 TRINITY_DN10324_c0_g1_i2:47-565(+)
MVLSSLFMDDRLSGLARQYSQMAEAAPNKTDADSLFQIEIVVGLGFPCSSLSSSVIIGPASKVGVQNFSGVIPFDIPHTRLMTVSTRRHKQNNASSLRLCGCSMKMENDEANHTRDGQNVWCWSEKHRAMQEMFRPIDTCVDKNKLDRSTGIKMSCGILSTLSLFDNNRGSV